MHKSYCTTLYVIISYHYPDKKVEHPNRPLSCSFLGTSPSSSKVVSIQISNTIDQFYFFILYNQKHIEYVLFLLLLLLLSFSVIESSVILESSVTFFPMRLVLLESYISSLVYSKVMKVVTYVILQKSHILPLYLEL